MNQITVFNTVLQHDVRVALRHRSELLQPLLFYFLVAMMFPLGVGVEKVMLIKIAPAIIWIAALLAALLSLDRLFRPDFQDGTLEQLVLSGHSLSLLILAKMVAHWLVTGLPLLLLAPLLALLLGLPLANLDILIYTLLLGTPVLSLVGAIGIALTVGLRRGGMILTILVLPLYTPVLIFASQTIGLAVAGLPVNASMAIMAAMLILALTLSPLATAAAIRMSLS